MSRLQALAPSALNPAQRAVYNRIATGARGGVRGPFPILLHSPALAGLVEQLGVYLRFQGAVPGRLRELAILVCAAHWRADFEWYAHAPLASRQGLTDAVLEAIGRGDAEPPFSDESDHLVFQYGRALLRTEPVPDALHVALRSLLGDAGLVDLTAVLGYYSMIAMTVNAFAIAAPADPAEATHQPAPPWRMP